MRLGREATLQLCDDVADAVLVESVQSAHVDKPHKNVDSAPERLVTESGLCGGCATKVKGGDRAELPGHIDSSQSNRSSIAAD